jgi:hypothetical protein
MVGEVHRPVAGHRAQEGLVGQPPEAFPLKAHAFGKSYAPVGVGGQDRSAAQELLEQRLAAGLLGLDDLAQVPGEVNEDLGQLLLLARVGEHHALRPRHGHPQLGPRDDVAAGAHIGDFPVIPALAKARQGQEGLLAGGVEEEAGVRAEALQVDPAVVHHFLEELGAPGGGLQRIQQGILGLQLRRFRQGVPGTLEHRQEVAEGPALVAVVGEHAVPVVLVGGDLHLLLAAGQHLHHLPLPQLVHPAGLLLRVLAQGQAVALGVGEGARVGGVGLGLRPQLVTVGDQAQPPGLQLHGSLDPLGPHRGLAGILPQAHHADLVPVGQGTALRRPEHHGEIARAAAAGGQGQQQAEEPKTGEARNPRWVRPDAGRLHRQSQG